MPMEPLSLFGRELDRAAVVRRVRELAGDVVTDSPRDDAWCSLTATFGGFWRRKQLRINYDPDFCSGPNWSRQMSGWRGYWSRFPDTPRKPMAMMLSSTFGFTLGTLLDPDASGPEDPRVQAIFAVAELLDCVIFTPSALLDARGRVLFGAGAADPDAAWPRVVGEVNVGPPRAATAASGGPDAGEDEDPEAAAPSAARVAMRALALAALTARGLLEVDRNDPDPARTCADVVRWARETGAMDEMEPPEREVLLAAHGTLPRQPQVDAVWRLEGLAVLLWALGRFEIPPHDRVVDAETAWVAAGLLNADAARALLAAPTLRGRGEIARLRGRMFALHWRASEFRIRPRPMDFAGFAASAWFGPLDITGLPLVDGDLAIAGARIDRAPADAFETARSIARERHLATNWLWEGPELYSDADQST
jgi:hypothetical protein